MSITSIELTGFLQRWRDGEGEAAGRVFELAYAELRQIAAQRLRHSEGVSTLSPTALLHEAYLRVAEGGVVFSSRAHFFAGMSLYIRSALVDHARARQAQKRGGGLAALSLLEDIKADSAQVFDVIVIDQVLQQLARLDARCADVLHLHCFAGLDRQTIAELLQLSLATIDRDLRFGRAFIREALQIGR